MSALSSTDARNHNESVAKLWDDYRQGVNERVPTFFATDEFLWLKLTGNTFGDFYTDARVQLATMLTGEAWFCENIHHDRAAGPPGTWNVAPRFWMDEPECFGCEVVIQEHDFAWSKPLELGKPEMLAHLRDINAEDAVLGSRLWRLYCDMREMADGMTWHDRPVNVVFPGGGTHGIFTTACRVRGAEQLCMDLIEDPSFADEFIGLITDNTAKRIRAWHKLAETGKQFPSADGWGNADDALQLISEQTFRTFVMPHWERLFQMMTTGGRRCHLCGYAQQHFQTLYDDLGIRDLDGPGPFADYARMLRDMPELKLSAQVEHMTVHNGPVSAIDEMMRDILTPDTCIPGRFSVTGFLFRDTPLEHVQAMYDAAVRYGRTGA